MKASRILEKLKRLESLICEVDRDTLAINKKLWQQTLTEAANLIESLTPRPIEEAPRDKYFITMNDGLVKIGLYNSRLNRVLSDNSIYLTKAKSFIPLSAIQALMESGE